MSTVQFVQLSTRMEKVQYKKKHLTWGQMGLHIDRDVEAW